MLKPRVVLCFVVGLSMLMSLTSARFEELNAKIEWKSLSDMKSFDFSKNDKPIMYLLTQPWCGACKRLKRTFVEEGQPKLTMETVSKQYIMVSVDGKENDKLGSEFAPDGGYIPRILFAEPSGKLRPDIKNPASPAQYKYFYTSAAQVAQALEANAGPLVSAARDEM